MAEKPRPKLTIKAEAVRKIVVDARTVTAARTAMFEQWIFEALQQG